MSANRKKARRTHPIFKNMNRNSTPISQEVLSSLGAPARRALQHHQIASLETLATYSEKELLQMHGLGKSAIPKLEAALQRAGRSLHSHTIDLRRSILPDLELFFEFQLDPDANHRAAFTSKDPSDKNAYMEKYTKLLNDPTIHMQTIVVDRAIAGSISKFEMDGEAEITYWISKSFWGRGVATTALRKFLALETTRPLRARAAVDNLGSRNVLERCGFVEIGRDTGFANARQAELEEVVYQLSRKAG